MGHVLLACGLMIYQIQAASEKPHLVEFEMTDSHPEVALASSPPPAPVEAPSQPEAPAPEAQAVRALPPPPSRPTSLPAQAKRSAQPTQSAAPVLLTAADSELTVPAGIENAELPEEAINESLNAIEDPSLSQISELQNQIAQETESEAQEQSARLSAIQAEAQKESARLALESRTRAEAAARALEAARAENESAQMKTGSGDGGISEGEVRSLAELKQQPGNKRPSYDLEDRRRGLKGDVVFLAYVSKEGSLTRFQMVTSSGHRQLDTKTYQAIRGWKFYPGQEGWVEIPFSWNLNGEPQEMPATLRRKLQASQNPNGPGLNRKKSE